MNTLKLKTLILEDFGIFRDKVILDFDGRDIIGILAEYFNAPLRSNRAGKTLIPEAIRYILTGLLRYKKAAQMIHKGRDVMFATGIFTDSNNKEYKIVRGVNKKGEGTLNLDWTEKSRESQAAIEDLFGIGKDDFDLTLFFKQSEINGFMDLGVAKKTDHLMKWLNNEHWKRKEARVKEDVARLKNELKDNETTVKALNESLELDENLDSEIELLEKKTKSASIKLKKARIARKEISDKLVILKSKRLGAKSKIEELEYQLDDIEKSEQEKAFAKTQIEATKVKIKGLTKKVPKDLEPKDKLDKKRIKINTALLHEKERFQKSTGHSGGMCPVLNETCDRIKPNKKDIELRKKTILDLKSTQNDILEEFDRWECAENIEEQIRKYKLRIEKYNMVINKKIIGNTEKIKAEVKTCKLSLNPGAVTKLDEKEETYNEEVSDLEGLVNRYNQNAGALKEKKRSNKDAQDRIATIEKCNRKIRSKLEIFLFIQSMFSKQGIAADEIENAFKEVQDDINFLLKELKTELTIVFSPDKELTKKEGICHCGFKYPKKHRGNCGDCDSPRKNQRSDEISLKIIENGIESDFEGDSGGGKTLLSYAVRIALTLLKRRQNKCKLNMLFLDEVDSALDPHFAASITDSITKLLVKKLGYEQIIMISHKEEIKKALPHIIQVTRYQDYSKAEFL